MSDQADPLTCQKGTPAMPDMPAPHPVTHRRRALLAAATAALAAGALTVTVAAAPAGAVAGRATSTYSVSAAGGVTGPGSQAPGRAAIKVTGKAGELLQLVRSRHGAGTATLLAGLGLINQEKPDPKPFEKDFFAYGGADVGHTFWVTLVPGDYYAVDVNNEKPTAAKVKHIHVARGTVSNAYPSYREIRAIDDITWDTKPASIPRAGTIRFNNKADQPHFIVLQRLKPGKTKADVLAVFSGKEKQGDVFDSNPKASAESGAISPHKAFFFTYSVPAGRYALLCFFPDATTGMPHAFMGMVRTITLT